MRLPLTGNGEEKVAPWPGSPLAQIRPPCRSTIRLQIARPMPVPGILAAAVQPLENHENLVLVLLLEADAVVPDAEEPLPLAPPGGQRGSAAAAPASGT